MIIHGTCVVFESFLILGHVCVCHTCCLRYVQSRTVDKFLLYCSLFTQGDSADNAGNDVVVGVPLDFQHTASFLPE
jgi:hypothetical protein